MVMALFEKILSFLALSKFKVKKIVLKQEVAKLIVSFAKRAAPREFLAFLKGEIRNNTLFISGLLYQPYRASKGAASTLPTITPQQSFIGSVHSHPRGSSKPSKADIIFFNKTGGIHLIVGAPFSISTIKAYDYRGEEIPFIID